MNLQTYLMIKSAAGAIDATDIALGTGVTPERAEATARKLRATQDKRNNNGFTGEPDPYAFLESNGYDELAERLGDPRIAGRLFAGDRKALQSALTRAQDRHSKATEKIDSLLADQEALKAQHASEVAGLKDQYSSLSQGYSELGNKYNAAVGRSRARGKRLVGANKALKNIGRFGGMGIGAAAGGGLGYGGGALASKALGLTGRKALAAKLIGATAGASLGGWGGYALGDNYMPQY